LEAPERAGEVLAATPENSEKSKSVSFGMLLGVWNWFFVACSLLATFPGLAARKRTGCQGPSYGPTVCCRTYVRFQRSSASRAMASKSSQRTLEFIHAIFIHAI